MIVAPVFAQERNKTVTGVITDEQKLPLPGVSIAINGSGNGTQSDLDGKFKIQAATGDQLVFSFIGLENKTITVGNTTELHIVLQSSSIGLKDVVVTALGITKNKKNLTYSTQAVEVKDLTKARELNVANSLSGKVAGIEITRGSSGLGGSTRVTLRGDRSISGNNQALFVIDGVPLDNSGGGGTTSSGGREYGDGISSVNPEDIESINVLKGASATALYGSRAANGAVIITTKKGASKKGLGINYSFGSQLDMPNLMQDYQNEYGQGNNGLYNRSSEQGWGPKLDGRQVATWSNAPEDAGKTYAFVANPDNIKNFYSPGTSFVNSLALNGGNETTQGYFSYTNTNAKGIVDNNTLLRNNFNVRLNSKFGQRISLDTKVTYLNEVIDNRQTTGGDFLNVNRQILRMPSNISLEDAQKYSYVNSAGSIRQNYWNPGTNGGQNPYWGKNNYTPVDERNRIIGFAALNYKIIPELNFTIRTGMDRHTDDVEIKIHTDTYTVAPKGNYVIEHRDIMELNHDFLFNFDKRINDFSITANAGGGVQKNKATTLITNNGGLVIENLFTTGNAVAGTFSRALSEREKQSLYATTDLGYKDFMTLSLTARNDWSSTLPKENNSYFFGSAGLNVILTEAFKLPSFISFAKIRGSIAQTGNDAPPYILSQTYTSGVGVPPSGLFVFRDGLLPIDGLKPEITTSQEAGIDLRVLDNRIGVEFTWFNGNSKNQLVQLTMPAASGWGAQYINAGNVQNKGIEFTVNGKIIKTNDLKWDLTVNYAETKNKVIEISPTLNEFVLGSDFMNTVKVIKGKPYGELYTRGFVRDASGNIIVDANGLPTTTSAQSVYVGNTRPKWTGSVMNKVAYKDFYLSFLVSARIGGVVSSYTNANNYGDGLAAETLEGRGGFVVDGVFADGTKNNKSITAEQYWTKLGGRNAPTGEVFTYSATNVRLREVVLGWDVPKSFFSKTPIQSANLSFSGRNLFFIKNNAKGFDPEVLAGNANSSVGLESFAPPVSRSFGVNLNLSF
ncbi:SusC/RagA family TonB-linked outer membrane protein [Flavobacterium gilvum]|uniref:SusC/RagA family TonB-linked outer membrane protein n=2 Tax=Flavobacterium gilvum TaxID=1492737 RepID=A0AAC9I776_9FLAO|nr:SusC/RagA family TonB-linked outer membrane protein [Flavobacterium gilvum]